MDSVERIAEQWHRIDPALNTSSLPIIGRILRIAALVSRNNDAALRARGLTRGEFDLLCALRRCDRPLRAAEICTLTGVSGAAITKWSEALVGAGLIERTIPERDRRGVLLALTDAGRQTVDAHLPEHLAREAEAVSALSAAERETLARLLAAVLDAAEVAG